MDTIQTHADEDLYSKQHKWRKLLIMSYQTNEKDKYKDDPANRIYMEKSSPKTEQKFENQTQNFPEFNNKICLGEKCESKCDKLSSLQNHIETVECSPSKIMQNDFTHKQQQQQQQHQSQCPPVKQNSFKNRSTSPEIEVNIVDTYRHLDLQRYTCPHKSCDFESKFLLAVKQHVEAVHKSILFKCSVCQKQFKTKAYLKRHSVTHLKSHLKHIFCAYPNCNYKCHKMEYLKSHMRIHRKEKMFGCQLCSQRFNHSNSLKRHMALSHGGEHSSFKNVFECPSCDYSSESSYHLNRHIRVHTGQKPYKCGQCPFAAVQKSDLTVHMMTHTGEKPLSCTSCEFKCARSNVLKRHERTHTGERPFKCPECSYCAAESGTLKSHVRTKHKIGQRCD